MTQSPFIWDKLFIATRLMNINIFYFNVFSLFNFKYRSVYMTMTTLNANNYTKQQKKRLKYKTES